MQIGSGVQVWLGVIGFGLAAQFDSLLLHRLLRWHHLLAGARAEALADAAFDAATAGVLLAGVVGLLVRRGAVAALTPVQGASAVLMGFGVWHLADAILIHALFRLHRVHPTAAHPLVWDIVWPAVFGVLPVLAACALRPARRGGTEASALSGTAQARRRSSGTRRRRGGPPPAA